MGRDEDLDMAGRLRKQLKVVIELDWAAHELSDRIVDAAPEGVFEFETSMKRIRGESIDRKTELWHEMSEAMSTCCDAAEHLAKLIEARIRKLPTYRSPRAARSRATPG